MFPSVSSRPARGKSNVRRSSSQATALRNAIAALGGSTGATDNAVLRADGTGGAMAQATGVTISDNNQISATSLVDNSINFLFAGLTKALRIGHSSAGVIFEGVDNTGGASYQPIFVGGSTLSLQVSGATVANINSSKLLNVSGGSFGRGAPVTKTADFTVAATENWLINNKTGSSCTVTLPAAASWPGREIMIQNYQAQTVISASANVVPLVGGSAATAILAGTAGKWAVLVSDGTNWIVTQAN